jgi:hypothetical protein
MSDYGVERHKVTGWLDTQTKEILKGSPPEKEAPALAAGFSLILLEKCSDSKTLQRALDRVLGVELERIPRILEQECPVLIKEGLPEEDALLGQFELICVDSLSVFIRDDVVAEGDLSYLSELYLNLRRSPEFEKVLLRVSYVPNNEEGEKFWDQFISSKRLSAPIDLTVTRKKARIMVHWGKRIGAELAVDLM